MDYLEMMKSANKNPFAAMMDLTIIDVKEGYSKVEINVQEKHLNPIGTVHGGCLYTMADVAAGAAAASHGRIAPTLDSSFHFLNAGKGTTHLTAEAQELKYGKRAMVYDVKIVDQDDMLVATGTFTFMNIGDKHLPSGE
jgi:acyl-CoA thioesterase